MLYTVRIKYTVDRDWEIEAANEAELADLLSGSDQGDGYYDLSDYEYGDWEWDIIEVVEDEDA